MAIHILSDRMIMFVLKQGRWLYRLKIIPNLITSSYPGDTKFVVCGENINMLTANKMLPCSSHNTSAN